MVVTIGTLLRNGFEIDDLLPCFREANIDIEQTGETGKRYIARRTVSHVIPSGLREDVYEELFHPGEKEPYSVRYFPDEVARNLRPVSFI